MYETLWDWLPFCILDYEHIFFSQTSPQGVLGKKLHPTKAGALAYLYKDIEMGTRELYKGQCKPHNTLPKLVSKYVKRLGK